MQTEVLPVYDTASTTRSVYVILYQVKASEYNAGFQGKLHLQVLGSGVNRRFYHKQGATTEAEIKEWALDIINATIADF